ncbi:MAG: protein kinase [Blastocatellia bacterium]|nr:protein kinase [Blastocatellia bacterium]
MKRSLGHSFSRVFLPVWTVLVGWSLLSGFPVLEPVSAQSLEVTAVTPEVSLADDWKTHSGDRLEWAQPTLDESSWTNASLAKHWNQPPVRGFSWYRKEIRLNPLTLSPQLTSSLGIALGRLDYGSYQLFANGILIGESRSGEPFPLTLPYLRAKIFRLPLQVFTKNGSVVLAVRLWQDPAYARRAAFYAGRHESFENRFVLGVAETLVAWNANAYRQRTDEDFFPRFFALLFVLVGLYHFQLYSNRRQLREYLWFGFFSIGFGINTLCNTVWIYELVSPFLADVVKVPVRHLVVIGFVRFLSHFLARPTKWFLPALEEVQVGCALIFVVWPDAVVTQISNLTFLTIIPVLFRFLHFTIKEAWNGQPDARTMISGMVLATVIELLMVARAFGLLHIPMIASWGMAGFVFSMAIALSNRFYRVYQELDSLNQELETKVEHRTAELAQTVAQLQQAKLLTERKMLEVSEKNQELVASQKQADRIFSALAKALPGTVLDEKYRLEREIGEGGFGIVFRGTHLALGRAIAIKVFKPRPGNDNADAIERFKREGISIARLTHPNIINVLDSGISTQGIAYMVMELLQGTSLAEELKTQKTATLERCLKLTIPVCQALAEAHRWGIIHRDIKPDNIFINQTAKGEVVKVVDFGIAKLVGDEDSGNFRTLTMTDSLIGTPVYMAPERLAAKPFDGRSDVYSLGVVLFEMLTGRPPFERDMSGLVGLMLAHLHDAPPSLRALNPKVPGRLEAIVRQTLEKDPEDRPVAAELARLLTEVLETALPAELKTVFHRQEPIFSELGTSSQMAFAAEQAETAEGNIHDQPTETQTKVIQRRVTDPTG